jgi:hypothetical protein
MTARFNLAFVGIVAGDSVSLAIAQAPLSCGQGRRDADNTLASRLFHYL